MAKIAIRGEKEIQELSLEKIKKILAEKHACYVLITCSEPSEEGKMEVEMSHAGDSGLVAYLLESAQEIFTHQLDRNCSN